MEYFEFQIQSNPEFEINLQSIESQVGNYVEPLAPDIITIPVVFHVVYNTTAENIPLSQITSQIATLNNDFRLSDHSILGKWPQASDVELEFCLATVDPQGNPTNGVTRTQTSKTSFSTNNDVKFTSRGGKDAWPRNDYLNIWVCDIDGSIIGYAQFPGGPSSTDGVVVDYQFTGNVGTHSTGRTGTHEVGHWLNLRHIWGDGDCSADDFVSDTPNSDGPNYGCPTDHISCNSLDMVENYMDYSNDACMDLFTNGQKVRMRSLFSPGGFRESLRNSTGCSQSDPNPEPEPDPSDYVILESDFESGLGGWIDGGSDCTLYSGPYSPNGNGSVQLRDNSGEPSSMYTNSLDLSPYNKVTLKFKYRAISYEDGEDFFVEFFESNNWVVLKRYQVRVDFQNNGLYESSITITDNLGSSNKFRIRSDASTNADMIYIDDVVITGQVTDGVLPTCNDGIQNGTETGVDCGGNCSPCAVDTIYGCCCIWGS